MGKFDQTDKEKFTESSNLDKQIFKFAVAGSIFTLLYFAIAFAVNPVSKAISLASVALILVVGISWIYWFVVKGSSNYYSNKIK